MTRKPLSLSASLLAAALAPAAASAADAQLGGAPTLRQIDSHNATLRFAADRLPGTAGGRIDARVTIGGERVGALRVAGRHGSDVVYRARFRTDRELRAGTKYTVRLVLAGGDPIVRKVKLHEAR